MPKQRIDGIYTVARIRPHHARRLSGLFQHALSQDFTYYSDDFLTATRQQNSTFKLALGSVVSSRILLGVWYGRKLIGYLIGARRPNSQIGDIFWLYVDPVHRGHGLGGALIDQSVAWLKQRQAEVVELVTYNHAPFYKGHGFEVERLAKGFIGGQDVYIMKRSLI